MLVMIKGIALICLLLVVPFLSGTMITRFIKKEKESIILNWVTGFVMVLGLVELLVVPATFLELSYGLVCGVFYGMLAVIAVAGLAWNRERIGMMLSDGIKGIPHTPGIVWLLVLLIAGQMFMYVCYMHEDSDDAFYVATALTTIEENSLFQVNPYTGEEYGGLPSRYVLSPFPVFNAMVSSAVRLHPTIVAHSVLPVILLLFTYGVFAILGQELFRNFTEKAGWMVFLSAIHLTFAGYSTSTQGSMMLLRIWQGKALLAAALLPLIFYMFLRLVRQKETWADWILMTTIMLACCMVSSMGIMIGAIMCGCCGLVAAGMRKSVPLLLKMALCAVPNIVLAVVYIMIR